MTLFNAMRNDMIRSFTSFSFLIAITLSAFAQGTKVDYDRAAGLRAKFTGKVFGDKVEPHWFANGDKFWYDVTRPGFQYETILIDAVAGTKTVIEKSTLPKDALPTRTAPATPPNTGQRARRIRQLSPDESDELFSSIKKQ